MKKFSLMIVLMVSLCCMAIQSPILADSLPAVVQPSGTGIQGDPYIIAEAGNLVWVTYNNFSNNGFSEKYFKQTANISLTGEWIPIGSIIGGFLEYMPFFGAYDGGNHIISGITMTEACENQGLFYHIGDSGFIENLIVNANIEGYGERQGALAGINYGSLLNCSSSGIVQGSYYGYAGTGIMSPAYGVGGLVGDNFGTINNCYSSCAVSRNDAGGLVGNNYGTIDRCYAVGAVYGGSVGGLVGWNESGSITNSYSTGSFSEDSGDIIGGFVGTNRGIISNCFSRGNINIICSSYIGSFVGYNDGTITNCFGTGNVNSNGSECYTGGISGLNRSTLTNCFYADPTIVNCVGSEKSGSVNNCTQQTNLAFYQTLSTYTTSSNWNASSEWDFSNTWGIDPKINSGYPYLISNVPSKFIISDYGIYSVLYKHSGIPTSGNYFFGATYINTSDAQSATCVVTLMSEKKLLKVYIMDYNFTTNETHEFITPITIPSNTSNLQLKCHIFNGFETMSPLSEVATLS